MVDDVPVPKNKTWMRGACHTLISKVPEQTAIAEFNIFVVTQATLYQESLPGN